MGFLPPSETGFQISGGLTTESATFLTALPFAHHD
ncbi:hypothetical protein Poly41_71220 [Novipirellula artificiosorum]|uniref:Uncharacterized protein n=1 Tax=Novipirellula artificiosorum TaxID=2528016 RepID=A0A5C6CFM6_9BACT|nr:hypothetical protein Poly41_71220 [Novipirellula artificiosorum]